MRRYRSGTWLCSLFRRRVLTRVRFALLQLLAPRIPIFNPLAHFRFEAAVGGIVEGLGVHAFGPVILARKSFVGIVVVGIALAVADILHQPRRGVEDVHRRHQRAGLLGASEGLLLRGVS